jgi:hypothetical protein
MRKILLATTAIVAMSAGSAMASDITISGSFELGYVNSSQNDAYTDTAASDPTGRTATVASNADTDFISQEMKNGSSMYVQSDVNINFSSTTDSGLTMKMGYGLDENGANDSANTDDINFSISGDFGEVYATSTADDSAARRLDIEAAYTNDESSTSHTMASSGLNSVAGESNAATTSGTIISYFLPSMIDGLSAGVSYSNAGTASKANATEWAAKYSGSASGMSYTIHYGAGSVDANGAPAADTAVVSNGSSTTGYGIEVSASGFTVGTESTSVDRDDNDDDVDYTATSVKYAMGDITVAYNVEDRNYATTDTSDVTRTAASVSYSIAPGLSASVTTSSTEEGSGTTQDTDDVTIFAPDTSYGNRQAGWCELLGVGLKGQYH